MAEQTPTTELTQEQMDANFEKAMADPDMQKRAAQIQAGVKALKDDREPYEKRQAANRAEAEQAGKQAEKALEVSTKANIEAARLTAESERKRDTVPVSREDSIKFKQIKINNNRARTVAAPAATTPKSPTPPAQKPQTATPSTIVPASPTNTLKIFHGINDFYNAIRQESYSPVIYRPFSITFETYEHSYKDFSPLMIHNLNNMSIFIQKFQMPNISFVGNQQTLLNINTPVGTYTTTDNVTIGSNDNQIRMYILETSHSFIDNEIEDWMRINTTSFLIRCNILIRFYNNYKLAAILNYNKKNKAHLEETSATDFIYYIIGAFPINYQTYDIDHLSPDSGKINRELTLTYNNIWVLNKNNINIFIKGVDESTYFPKFSIPKDNENDDDKFEGGDLGDYIEDNRKRSNNNSPQFLNVKKLMQKLQNSIPSASSGSSIFGNALTGFFNFSKAFNSATSYFPSRLYKSSSSSSRYYNRSATNVSSSKSSIQNNLTSALNSVNRSSINNNNSQNNQKTTINEKEKQITISRSTNNINKSTSIQNRSSMINNTRDNQNENNYENNKQINTSNSSSKQTNSIYNSNITNTSSNISDIYNTQNNQNETNYENDKQININNSSSKQTNNNSINNSSTELSQAVNDIYNTQNNQKDINYEKEKQMATNILDNVEQNSINDTMTNNINILKSNIKQNISNNLHENMNDIFENISNISVDSIINYGKSNITSNNITNTTKPFNITRDTYKAIQQYAKNNNTTTASVINTIKSKSVSDQDKNQLINNINMLLESSKNTTNNTISSTNINNSSNIPSSQNNSLLDYKSILEQTLNNILRQQRTTTYSVLDYQKQLEHSLQQLNKSKSLQESAEQFKIQLERTLANINRHQAKKLTDTELKNFVNSAQLIYNEQYK